MLKTILITNDTLLAQEAEEAGVTHIMVDLEWVGKAERQKTRNTFISKHQPTDIAPMRKALSRAKLMVRINPWHEHSPKETEDAIDRGAECIMLPMITDLAQLTACIDHIDSRVPILPLIETRYSMEHLEAIAVNQAVERLYFGLNDLHLSLGMRFLFEPLAEGHIDRMAAIVKKHQKPFGFGGIAALSGKAELPAINILAEHARLGSTCVILSSRFAKDMMLEEPLGRSDRLKKAVGELHTAYEQLSKRTASEAEHARKETATLIQDIAMKLRKL